MIYLYGVAMPGGPALEAALREIPGVTGPVRVRKVIGGIALLSGAHDGGELLPARRHMLAHTRVLEAAMAVSTILPMRFGSVAEDEKAFLALLRTRADEIAGRVASLRGLQEFGIRIRFPREAALAALLDDEPALAAERDRLAAAASGASFEAAELGRRVAEALVARRDAAADRLAAALAPMARRLLTKPPEEDVEVLRAEVLLQAGSEDAFAMAALDHASRLGFAGQAEASVRLVGPSPAFHFADLALGQNRNAA